MDNLKQIFEETLKENENSEIKMIGKKTLDEWETEFSQALYDEFKDDPEYQRRAAQK